MPKQSVVLQNLKTCYRRNYDKRPILRDWGKMVTPSKVADQKERSRDLCVTQLSVMLQCLDENEFNDKACQSEVKAFKKCIANTKVEVMDAEEQAYGGVAAYKKKASTESVNKLLKRHK